MTVRIDRVVTQLTGAEPVPQGAQSRQEPDGCCDSSPGGAAENQELVDRVVAQVIERLRREWGR